VLEDEGEDDIDYQLIYVCKNDNYVTTKTVVRTTVRRTRRMNMNDRLSQSRKMAINIRITSLLMSCPCCEYRVPADTPSYTVRPLKLPKSSEDIILLTRSIHFPSVETSNHPHGSFRFYKRLEDRNGPAKDCPF
jgi:hypothetical protein